MPPQVARANAAIARIVLAVEAACLFGALTIPVARPFALLAFVAGSPAHWGLVHEAIHGLLAPNRRLNHAGGRLLAMGLGYSFEVVRLGHLLHHAASGHPLDRPDRGDGPRWRAAARHYGHLLGGQNLVAAGTALLAFLPWPVIERVIRSRTAGDPHIEPAALRWFAPARRRRAIRIDVVIGWTVFGLALVLQGPAWPWLLLALYGRALLLSLMDNMPHYGTDGRHVAEIPVFRAPAGLAFAVMNRHLHRLHHERPSVPWCSLPEASDPAAMTYLRGLLRQLRGPTVAGQG